MLKRFTYSAPSKARQARPSGTAASTHPVLPTLPQAAQRQEIRQSKRELEQLLGRPITSFAYPYGHYAPETATLVREAGFSSACSVEAGLVKRDSDPLRLPRVGVEDWDGDQLARVLADWFER